MKDAPPQAVRYANPSGWTDEELFPKWLEHFTSITNCSTENRHVVLLDGHHSHQSLQAMEYCCDHGIELITLAPHSTHKMQPLDRSYFKSLKKAFSTESDNWMVTNPGRRITIHDMAGLTGKAFLRTAVPERAINGFRTWDDRRGHARHQWWPSGRHQPWTDTRQPMYTCPNWWRPRCHSNWLWCCQRNHSYRSRHGYRRSHGFRLSCWAGNDSCRNHGSMLQEKTLSQDKPWLQTPVLPENRWLEDCEFSSNFIQKYIDIRA